MLYQSCTTLAKEYTANSGVLTIESVFTGGKKKTEVIREILEIFASTNDKALLQSKYGNNADCGSR